MSLDPLASTYPSVSPYTFVLNNPIIFIDPNGKKVFPTSEEALNIIRLSLSPNEAEFVKLDSKGYIDVDLLNQGTRSLNVGGNYQTLLSVATDTKIVEIIVSESYEGINQKGELVTGSNVPFQFKDPTNDAKAFWLDMGGNSNFTGKIIYNNKDVNFLESQAETGLKDQFSANGGVCKTSSPFGTPVNTEFDRNLPASLSSTNRNYQVYVNKRLLKHTDTEETAVVTLAHELFGHLSFMFLNKSSSHGPVRTDGPNANRSNFNKELETEISNRSNEAKANYNARKQ